MTPTPDRIVTAHTPGPPSHLHREDRIDKRRRRKATRTGFPLEAFERLDAACTPAIRGDLKSLIPPALSAEDAVAAFWQAWFYLSEVDRTAELDVWIRYARAVGWAGRDGQPRPDAAIQLYRGAPESSANGLSWTPDRAVAAEFARTADFPGDCVLGRVRADATTAAEHARAGKGIVWAISAPPEALLGVQREPVGDGHGGIGSVYEEYLVDVDGLEVAPFAVAANATNPPCQPRQSHSPNRAARRRAVRERRRAAAS